MTAETQMLAEAWRISGLTGEEYAREAHDFVCHAGERCDRTLVSECSRSLNFERSNMLGVAVEVRRTGGTIVTFVETWLTN